MPVDAALVDAPLKAYAGTLVDFQGHPDDMALGAAALRCIADGLLVVKHGKIVWVGERTKLLPDLAAQLSAPGTGARVYDYSPYLIMPGFIDTHIHYPQTEMIACYGRELLTWLNDYTFPTESRFADEAYAHAIAGFFVDELLRNGTTSALVFATTHSTSVDALFTVAEKINMRLITGKVLMDRHAPAELCQEPSQAYDESRRLIERWHKHGRLLYAVTPRFAASCSPATLKVACQLREEFADTYLHTHLAENRDEVAWVAQLFPEQTSYLGVYDHFGLVGKRSVFAHCLHLQDNDWQRLGAAQAAIAHCPSSNLFLGSGLFNWQQARAHAVGLGMGTDVGAGTSFSLLRTLGDAYKVAALQGQRLSPLQAFYYLTLGGAKALGLDDRLGNFAVGKEADFVVVDAAATDLQGLRRQFGASRCQDAADVTTANVTDQLFSLMTLGDDRNIKATHLQGDCVYKRPERPEPMLAKKPTRRSGGERGPA